MEQQQQLGQGEAGSYRLDSALFICKGPLVVLLSVHKQLAWCRGMCDTVCGSSQQPGLSRLRHSSALRALTHLLVVSASPSQTYAAAFFALPLIRMFVDGRRNTAIEERNDNRVEVRLRQIDSAAAICRHADGCLAAELSLLWPLHFLVCTAWATD